MGEDRRELGGLRFDPQCPDPQLEHLPTWKVTQPVHNAPLLLPPAPVFTLELHLVLLLRGVYLSPMARN